MTLSTRTNNSSLMPSCTCYTKPTLALYYFLGVMVISSAFFLEIGSLNICFDYVINKSILALSSIKS